MAEEVRGLGGGATGVEVTEAGEMAEAVVMLGRRVRVAVAW